MRRLWCVVVAVAAMAAGLAMAGCGGGGTGSSSGSSSPIESAQVRVDKSIELTREDGSTFIVSPVVSRDGVQLTPSNGTVWVTYADQRWNGVNVEIGLVGLPAGSTSQIRVTNDRVGSVDPSQPGRWTLPMGRSHASFDATIPNGVRGNYRLSGSLNISVDTPIVTLTDKGDGVIVVTRTDGSVERYTIGVYQGQTEFGGWRDLHPSPENLKLYQVKIPAGATTTLVMINSEPPLPLDVTAPGGVPLSSINRYRYSAGEYDVGVTVTVGGGSGAKSVSTTLHLSIAAS